MRATNSTILAIYNHFKYYLFVNMAKKNLDHCWFYNYIEEFNDLGIFYFKAVDKLDPSTSCKVLIAIDKYMYKYYDDLVGIFRLHEGWVFDMSDYDYDRNGFDIIFENKTRFGIRKDIFGITDEGVVIKCSRYTDDYFNNINAEISLNLAKEYCINDLIATNDAINYTRECMQQLRPPVCKELPTFKFNNSGGRVPALSKPPIFNPPATICYWDDGTKTVVKCQKGDIYSPEAGLALCYMKKILGNTSKDLNKELHKYIPEEKEVH